MRHYTLKQKARMAVQNKAYKTALRAFLLDHPEELARYRAKESADQRARMTRLKADPITKKAILARGREDQAKVRARRNSTPESREMWKQKLNASSRRRYKERMATDPVYAEYQRKRTREYFRNTENGRKLRRETMNRCYHGSMEFKLAANIRKRIAGALRGRDKFGNSKELIGCTMTEYKAYLTSLFKPGMTMDNYGRGIGKWNVDHIIPLASVDLSTEESQLKHFHYTNTQPMWWEENLIKSSVYNGKRWRYHDHMQQPPTSISA